MGAGLRLRDSGQTGEQGVGCRQGSAGWKQGSEAEARTGWKGSLERAWKTWMVDSREGSTIQSSVHL